jgi:integrase/recombinase XerD
MKEVMEMGIVEVKEENQKLIKSFLNALKLKGNSPNTISGYNADLQAFFNKVDVNALEVTFKDINPYFLNLMGEEKAPRTINRKMAAIRCFYKFLVKNEHIKDDPTVKLESSKVAKRLPEYLTENQIREVINVAKNYRDKVIMMVLYTTGARLSEIHRLNRNDIDFINKKIIVIGKGNKQGTVYLNTEACEMLKKYLGERIDNCEALFISNQKQRLGKRYYQQMVKKYGQKVGISGVHPHLYRHSLASKMAIEGIQIQTIQEVLRHESISTTQMYAHLSNEKIRSDYDKIMERKSGE